MLAQAKKEKTASKKRKKEVLVSNTIENCAKIAKLVPSENFHCINEELSYQCGNPNCGVTSMLGDADNGWLQCECCTPPLWTCGVCAAFMQQHEDGQTA